MSIISQFEMRRDGMPADMQTLLNTYPRDTWEAHPGFKEKTQHWLGAHQMFRRLEKLVRSETELYLGQIRARGLCRAVVLLCDALVRNLHGHHGWEDHSYFPELSAADPRFDAGLGILEQDHQALVGVLAAFTSSANRAIKLIQLDEAQARDEAGHLHGVVETIDAFLARQLSDEEELAVPIILHHRLRG